MNNQQETLQEKVEERAPVPVGGFLYVIGIGFISLFGIPKAIYLKLANKQGPVRRERWDEAS